eukprot:snap_masked-scaffold_5-processed-gene-8.40-mRNA-1 protein AED:1.00 eAED:1.00 QI:0/-1/0/0/-1/1/1/0/226
MYLKTYSFIFFWSLALLSNIYILIIATKKPLPKDTPRFVYTFYNTIHNTSYQTTFFVYILLAISFVLHQKDDPSTKTTKEPFVHLASTVFIYGIYFGVLYKDCAYVFSNHISHALNLQKKSDEPKPHDEPLNNCALCDVLLVENDPTLALHCGDRFHESCLKGWVLIGKADSCPKCSVNLTGSDIFKRSFWEASENWNQLLDAVRNLTVWTPLILLGFESLKKLLS